MKLHLIILIAFILVGCTQAVCRHDVLRAAAVAEERQQNYKIVVYEVDVTNPFEWGHAQVRLDDGRWMCSLLDYYWICNAPLIKPNGRQKAFTAQEWLDTLRKGSFKW